MGYLPFSVRPSTAGARGECGLVRPGGGIGRRGHADRDPMCTPPIAQDEADTLATVIDLYLHSTTLKMNQRERLWQIRNPPGRADLAFSACSPTAISASEPLRIGSVSEAVLVDLLDAHTMGLAKRLALLPMEPIKLSWAMFRNGTGGIGFLRPTGKMTSSRRKVRQRWQRRRTRTCSTTRTAQWS